MVLPKVKDFHAGLKVASSHAVKCLCREPHVRELWQLLSPEGGP